MRLRKDFTFLVYTAMKESTGLFILLMHIHISVKCEVCVKQLNYELTLAACGISYLLHSVSLILFTVLLVHLILHTSPHHSLSRSIQA